MARKRGMPLWANRYLYVFNTATGDAKCIVGLLNAARRLTSMESSMKSVLRYVAATVAQIDADMPVVVECAARQQ